VSGQYKTETIVIDQTISFPGQRSPMPANHEQQHIFDLNVAADVQTFELTMSHNHPQDLFVPHLFGECCRLVQSRIGGLRESGDAVWHLLHVVVPNLVLGFVQASKRESWTSEFARMLGEITSRDANIIYTRGANWH
jgi:hypothetical protein